jgi:hypothetical protein
MNDIECVEKVLVNISARTFVLVSDQGGKKEIVCETGDQFMSVLDIVNQNIQHYEIVYSDLPTCEKIV